MKKTSLMNLANLAISDISGHWAHSWCSVCLIPDTAEVGNLPINRQEVAWPSDVDRYGDPPDPRGMGDVAIGGWRKVIQLRETRSVWVALMRMFQIEGCQACGLRCNCMPIYIYILYAYTNFRECSTRTLSKGLRMDTLCINKVLT